MTTNTYIPLDQAESASHKSAETLLATNVYSKLREFIQAAVDSLGDGDSGRAFHANRRHNATLIDGARGTGKSSVLVNLATALDSPDDGLLKKVHILKPVDPTLLETDDDLFLNVIVAAVLSDSAVIEAQERKSQQRQDLQRTLQNLGGKLESMQSQRNERGLDKVRSFIGNHQLIEEVHNFFAAVLRLLGKKLLVLTIDDVDTSLNRAFENLEVVRRYLTTPYVLPILSGDLSLYHEVTWRDFHGRLLKDTTYQRRDAYDRAHQLAVEYQRKVLPFQYRLAMPNISDYLKDEQILLGHANGEKNLSLPLFHAWLEGLVNGSVNGLENSYLPVPLTSLRALTQLVYRLKKRIPELSTHIKNDWSPLRVRRALLMPPATADALKNFHAAYRLGASNDSAYADFERDVSATGDQDQSDVTPLRRIADAWCGELADHFRVEPEAGPAYMVMLAYQYWQTKPGVDEVWRSVFDTPLFQPLRHDELQFPEFDRKAELSEWRDQLRGRAPESWLARLPVKAILPYPVPEAGRATRLSDDFNSSGDGADDVNLLLELLLHRNFYSSSQRGLLVCTGRVIELLVTSLLRDVDDRDIGAILQRPPFYSFSAFAGTKTIPMGQDDDSVYAEPADENAPPLPQHAHAIARLAIAINKWRNDYGVARLHVSPWLIYNVLNKTINQAWLFNRPLKHREQPKTVTTADVAWTARQTFYSLWAAFGSFEKGPLFGLPDVVAYMNIGEGANFQNSNLYLTNVAPFYNTSTESTHSFGARIRAVTAVLGEHPLRALIDRHAETPKPAVPRPAAVRQVQLSKSDDTDISPRAVVADAMRIRRLNLPTETDAKVWLRETLGISRVTDKPVRLFVSALRKLNAGRNASLELAATFRHRFPEETKLAGDLTTAVNVVFPTKTP
ncbi:antiviral RADAR system adenosine triphosphatase RdrA [Caballeronia sp. DA-9]|uniref:antiviral RADAR system adenosine triphosphatase RdrA n=1 Tax=Caballeronia sp. DA-9 TaxID=3436237 RepID=UPI003F680888